MLLLCGLEMRIRKRILISRLTFDPCPSRWTSRSGQLLLNRTLAGRTSHCKTRTPINDASAFLALSKILTAANPAAAMWALPFKDKLRVLKTLTLVQPQMHQTIKPYQQLRYESNVPFRHGPIDVVKYSATPSANNHANPLDRKNPNGLRDELIRHVQEGSKMSSFDFGVQ